MSSLVNKTVAVDSMIFIYLLDQDPRYWEKVASLLEEAKHIIVSSLLFGEVLAGLYRNQDHKSAERFWDFIQASEKITVLPFGTNTAIAFAKLRGREKPLPPADCIHLATAIEAKADCFLTNDKKIKHVPGIEVLYLENF